MDHLEAQEVKAARAVEVKDHLEAQEDKAVRAVEAVQTNSVDRPALAPDHLKVVLLREE